MANCTPPSVIKLEHDLNSEADYEIRCENLIFKEEKSTPKEIDLKQMLMQSNSLVPPELARHEDSLVAAGPEQEIQSDASAEANLNFKTIGHALHTISRGIHEKYATTISLVINLIAFKYPFRLQLCFAAAKQNPNTPVAAEKVLEHMNTISPIVPTNAKLLGMEYVLIVPTKFADMSWEEFSKRRFGVAKQCSTTKKGTHKNLLMLSSLQ
ncbi:hypothetical protein Tco_0127194 [Tanacetum coccineum]